MVPELSGHRERTHRKIQTSRLGRIRAWLEIKTLLSSKLFHVRLVQNSTKVYYEGQVWVCDDSFISRVIAYDFTRLLLFILLVMLPSSKLQREYSDFQQNLVFLSLTLISPAPT